MHCNNSFASQEIEVLISMSAWGVLHFTSLVFQRQLCLTGSNSSESNSLPSTAALKSRLWDKDHILSVVFSVKDFCLTSVLKKPMTRFSLKKNIYMISFQTLKNHLLQSFWPKSTLPKYFLIRTLRTPTAYWPASFGGILWLCWLILLL